MATADVGRHGCKIIDQSPSWKSTEASDCAWNDDAVGTSSRIVPRLIAWEAHSQPELLGCNFFGGLRYWESTRILGGLEKTARSPASSVGPVSRDRSSSPEFAADLRHRRLVVLQSADCVATPRCPHPPSDISTAASSGRIVPRGQQGSSQNGMRSTTTSRQSSETPRAGGGRVLQSTAFETLRQQQQQHSPKLHIAAVKLAPCVSLPFLVQPPSTAAERPHGERVTSAARSRRIDGAPSRPMVPAEVQPRAERCFAGRLHARPMSGLAQAAAVSVAFELPSPCFADSREKMLPTRRRARDHSNSAVRPISRSGLAARGRQMLTS